MRIKSSLTRPTVKRREAKGNSKNGTTVRAGPKRRNRSREGKASRECPPVSYERAKTVVERERKKATRKRCESIRVGENGRKRTRQRYEHFRRSQREGENGRKRTQETRDPRRGGKEVSLAVCPTVQKLSSRLAWQRESTGEFMERQTTEHPQNT